ncbi:hypothetical protein [Aeromicrobium fastidiosum]|nr:hypothetical protein [Aeromicrobium fastidiosum]
MAIVIDMSTSSGPHRVRTLFLLALLIGAALGLRAAVADKGGSYDPADVR